MRPFIRRAEFNDLDAARRLVAAAEREALDRAEELRREAEELLDALTCEAQTEPSADDVAADPDVALSGVAAQSHLARGAGAVLVAAPGDGIPEMAALVKEVQQVLSAALAAAEREASRAVEARQQAERILRQAAEDAARIRAEARAEGLARARQEAASGLARQGGQLRAALEQAGSALEQFLADQDGALKWLNPDNPEG